MILNKTDYLIYRDCPKNAWLKIHKPEVYKEFPPSMFDQMLFKVGNEIDELARQLFPGGVLLKNLKDNTKTKELVGKKEKILYQPVFITKRHKAIPDTMVWNRGAQAYDVFEVKSTTDGGNKKSKERDYSYDLAFQKNVLEIEGVKINKTYLVRLDHQYIRGNKLDINSLFITEDFSDQVNELLEEVKLEMEAVYNDLNVEEEPQGHCSCILKGRNSHCTTFKYSNPDVPDYSVHNLSRIGSSKKKLAELIDSGIFEIKDIPDEFELSTIQKNQVYVTKTGKTIFLADEVAKFLDDIKYPISFIDYETFPSAIPRFSGYSPFNQIPFQFSLHVINEPGGEIKHDEFIFLKNVKPDLAFLQALDDKVPKEGSIIVWNKTFEMGINRKLAQRNPEWEQFVESFNDRVVDLLDIFSKQFYVRPEFKGKTSIKYILPALAPELSYKNLEIQEGATASNTWNDIVLGNIDKEEGKKKAKALLKYCALDTYAMVAIWRQCLDQLNE